MEKTKLALLLTTVILVNLLVLSSGTIGNAQASTTVAGVISVDTVWTQANSPYTLTGPLLVKSGVTLKIESGVNVNINNTYLEVNGTLTAQGTHDQPVTFLESRPTYSTDTTLDLVYFTRYSTNWNQTALSGGILENCIFDKISVFAEESSPKIANNTFLNSLGIQVGDGSPLILNNYMLNSQIHLVGSNYNAIIIGNYLVGKGIDTIADCPSIIQNNLVTNASYGIRLYCLAPRTTNYGFPLIQNNTFCDNKYGVTFFGSGCINLPINTIHYNNIYSNEYNIISGWDKDSTPIEVNINASLNWWGTNESQAIDKTIYDLKYNFNMGTITFTPFLNSTNPFTWPTDYVPQIPLQNGENLSPTPNPTIYPNQTKSPDATPPPTPEATRPSASTEPLASPSSVDAQPVNPKSSDEPLNFYTIWPYLATALLVVIIAMLIVILRRRK